MKVGDLIHMPHSVEPITGIILQTIPDGDMFKGRLTSHSRIKIYWIEDAEVSWEPMKWLEVLSER